MKRKRLFIYIPILITVTIAFLISRWDAIFPEKDDAFTTAVDALLEYEDIYIIDTLTPAGGVSPVGEDGVSIDSLAFSSDGRRAFVAAHPGGIRCRGFRIGERSTLDFVIGIPTSGKKRMRGVVFTIRLESGERDKTIFKKTLFTQQEWHDYEIDLSDFAGEVVDIIFTAHPIGSEGVGAWSEPLLSLPPSGGDWPLIILISIDTLRRDHLGCYGYHRNTSPHIDAFAGDGIRYDLCIAQAPFTPTSHASMLTGLYPNKTMAYTHLAEEFLSWAEILSTLGYETVSYNGSGLIAKEYGFDQGFDGYHSYPFNQARENDIVWEMAGAMEYIRHLKEKDTDEKHFLFLHTYEVHSWYKPPAGIRDTFLRGEEYFLSKNRRLLSGNITRYLGKEGWGPGGINRYREMPAEHRDVFIDLYDAEIYYTDVWLGRFFELLKREGLYDDALIILTSDHGEEFYEHGGWCHSHQLYGEVITVPLIIKYPKGTKRGVEDARLARHIDLLPTVLYDVLDVSIEGFDFDGVPLSKPIENEPTLTFTFNGSNCVKIALYHDDLKYVMNFHDYAAYEPERPTEEVFRFTTDPADRRRISFTDAERSHSFRGVVGMEKALADINRERWIEHTSGLDLDAGVDEEIREKLKDLGYLQ
jgi:arylsulfatase A-like enzyme